MGGPSPLGGGGYPVEYPKGTQIFVLGLLSFLCCNLLGPVALIQGNNARKEMAASPNVEFTNKGMVTAGWVLGILGTIGLVLGIIYAIVIFATQ